MIHRGDKIDIAVLQLFFIIVFFISSLEAASCNCCTNTTETEIERPFVSSLSNHCTKWIIIPIENGFVAPIQIYDPSIKEHDHDCDGIVDSLDPDVDANGIVVNSDYATLQRNEKILIDVLENDMDIEGFIDAKTLKITTKPKHGSVKVVQGKVYYAPDGSFTGYDSFMYTVRDNDGFLSKPVLVKILVTDINHPPIAKNASYSIKEDTPVKITLVADDPDKDGLRYKIIKSPKSGRLVGTVPNLTYLPQKDFHGQDLFLFQVNDGKIDSKPATVYINILPVNDAPIAVNDHVKTKENMPVAVDALINDYDPDGDTIRLVSVSKASFGKVLLLDGKIYYSPGSNTVSSDRFTYTIADESGLLATATIDVLIDIKSKNDAPVAFNQTVTTKEGEPISFTIIGSDPEGDPIGYHLRYITELPSHGTVTGTPPQLTYRPEKDFYGKDYVAFSVSDGELESSIGIITIDVLPINDPPVADAGEDYEGIRGDLIHFDGSGSYDIDGNITSYVWREGNTTLSTQPKFETKMLDEGTHTVTLTVTDDHNATGSDQKIITINPCCQGCVYPDPTATNPFN